MVAEPVDEPHRIVAFAECTVSADAESAEVGLLVEDAWQHNGLDRVLFDRLLMLAESRGIRSFIAYVQWSNVRVIHALDRFATLEPCTAAHGIVLDRRAPRPLAFRPSMAERVGPVTGGPAIRFFSWIRRLTTHPADLRLEGPGDYDFEIVGEASYQDALETIASGRTDDGHRRVLVTARLVHEDENLHDVHAIRVDVNGRTVAYLTRASARIYRRWLAGQGHAGRTATCSAVIVGGWDRGPRGRGHFGIKLDLPSPYSPT